MYRTIWIMTRDGAKLCFSTNDQEKLRICQEFEEKRSKNLNVDDTQDGRHAVIPMDNISRIIFTKEGV